MKRPSKREGRKSRRRFLRSAAMAGGAATIVFSGQNVLAGAEQAAEGETVAKPNAKGYHPTQHILAYYKSARA